MRYCTRCLYPENHPLNLVFDAQGVCSGCRVHEEKDTLDWTERGYKLKKLLQDYRSHSRHNYDCIVPVSGARDSYFIVHTLKKVFGMNPLLVSYNRHYNTRRGHRNYAYLKTLFNCDAVEMVVEPEKVKRVTRTTLRKMGSFHWHVLAGQTVFPVQIAVRFKIPLIVWGAHQGVDQVGMYSHTDEVEMTRKYRKEHDLMGFEAEDLANPKDGLSEFDILPYVYPHDKELEKTGVRGIYLNNYIRWDSKAQHEEMIKLYGYETAALRRSFDTYNDVDCQHYLGAHDLVKWMKWGYGKVTDHATREIRLKRMSREEGVQRVQQFGQVPATDLPLLLDWLNMRESEFMDTINRFRDLRAWTKDGGVWSLKDPVDSRPRDPRTDSVRLSSSGSCDFVVTPSRDPSANEAEYALIHKGFVHQRDHVAEARAHALNAR